MIKSIITSSFALLLFTAVGYVAFGADQKITAEETEQVKNAIADYVNRDNELKGSFFIYDEESDTVLDLKYDHTHKAVKQTENGKYFACVDFVDRNKNIYDLDFFLDKTDLGTWEVEEIVIHKVNGVNKLKQ